MELVTKDRILIEQFESSLEKTKTLIKSLSDEELDSRYVKKNGQ